MRQFVIEVKAFYHLCVAAAAAMRYGFPARRLRVIMVTGTDGKTTTSTLIYHFLKAAGKKVALISTVAAYIGDEEIDTGFHVTTPSPFQLQRLVKNITDQGYEYLVLEATSHGIHQRRLFGIVPEVAVLTNITDEHLDYHGSYMRYAAVKLSLLRTAKIAVVNTRDRSYALVQKMLDAKNVAIIPYSAARMPKKLLAVAQKRFREAYNLENVAAAVAAARAVGVTDETLLHHVMDIPQIPGRMEVVHAGSPTVIVDFAHTPNALEQALSSARKNLKNHGRLIAIYGSAGLRDAQKRPAMGAAGDKYADEVILTAEDPRTENVNVIIRSMKEGVRVHYGHVHEIADRREAIRFAIGTLAAMNDIVMICGKGHEKSMNLDGRSEIPWSDQKEAMAALQLRKQHAHTA